MKTPSLLRLRNDCTPLPPGQGLGALQAEVDRVVAWFTRLAISLATPVAAARPRCPAARPGAHAAFLLAIGLGLTGTSTLTRAQDGGAAAAALKILMTPAAPTLPAGAGALMASPSGTRLVSPAAAPATDLPSGAGSAGASSVQVQRGETLDRIIRRSLGQTPFSAEFLRKAFVQLNPHAFRSAGNPHLISAGSTLQVPSAGQLQALMQTHYPHWAASPEDGHSGLPQATDAEARKRWVRYP